jgi:hypothetical protein
MNDLKSPNVFFPGPPKTGTTSVHSFLSKQEGILFSSPKETMFFSDEIRYKKGMNWYLKSYFAHFNGQKIIADCSPSYFSSKKAIDRIMLETDNPRFFILLRSPIKRSYSAYLHLKRDGLVKEEFKVLMSNIVNNQINYSKQVQEIYTDSLYAKHLYYLMKKVSHKDIYIFLFEEEVKTNFSSIINKLEEIYNIELRTDQVFIHKGEATETTETVAFIRGLVNKPSFIKKIAKKVFPLKKLTLLRHKFNQLMIKSDFSKPVDKIDEDWGELNRLYFKEEINELSNISKIDYTIWF